MKKILTFITKIKSFWEFYKDYEYDGDSVRFIIDNYEKLLCNRTKTMSKPTYFLKDILREIDRWYEEREGTRVYSTYNYRTNCIDFSVEFRNINSKGELMDAVIKKMADQIEKQNFPE